MNNEQVDRALLQDSVRDIMTNKDNPHNAGYWRQDAAAMAHVDGLYKAHTAKYPGGGVVIDEGGIDVTGKPPEAEKPKEDGKAGMDSYVKASEEAKRDALEVVAPEDREAHEEMTKELRGVWGADFDTQRAAADRGLREIEGHYGKEGALNMLDDYIKEGGTYAEAAKFLARRGAK